MPVFNWVALKPNQINGTVFNEIDDERILEVKGLTYTRLCHSLNVVNAHSSDNAVEFIRIYAREYYIVFIFWT